MKSFLPLFALIATSLHAGTPAISKASAKNPKAPQAAAVVPAARSPWRVTAGAQWRTLGDASFNNDSQAPSFALPNFSGVKASAGASGQYDNGYVLGDITGDANTTWNFGYTDNAQLQGGTLSFQGYDLSVTTETTRRTLDSDWDESADGFGGFLKLESPALFDGPGFTLSATAGYSYTRADIDHSGLAFQATQRTEISGGAFIDSYPTLGAAIPGAPYSGTFNGPGPFISRNATRRYTGGSSGATEIIETDVESRIANELNVNLHTLSFGPQINYQPKTSPVRFSASLGLSINIADWEARTEETLRIKDGSKLASWRSENSGTEVLPGFYVEASAELPITAKLCAYAAARYDVSRELHGSTAHSQHTLDISGFTAQVGISFKF